MRKKFLSRFLCLMLIITMTLTACQKTPGSNEREDDTQENSEIGQEELTQSDILDNAEILDEDTGLYYVPNERIEANLQQEIAIFGNQLMVSGYGQISDSGTAFCISLISLETGEVLKEKTFEETDFACAQVCGDKIALTDWGLGKVTILDRSLNVLDEYETQTDYCSIYLNQDATKIYCFTQDGVKVISTSDGSTQMLFENATMLFGSVKCGNSVTVTFTDKNTQMNEKGVVNLETGRAEKIPFEDAVHMVESEEGVWLAGVLGEENQYFIGKSSRPKSFVANGQYTSMTLIADPLRLMETRYDEDGRMIVTLYNLDGKYLSQTQMPENISSMICEPIWSEADGGYFIIMMDNELGKDKLLFWDMSKPAAGEDINLVSAYDENADVDTEVSEELLSRAKELGEKYGIRIVMGDQTEDSYDEYNMAHEMGEEFITQGLAAIESGLAKYPDGFMSQLLYGDQKALEIHLTGAFTLKEYPEGNVNGFTSFIGLAYEHEGKTFIIIDITMASSIEQTLHHEIMHVIDHKLTFDSYIREDAFFSEESWAALNPTGFSYVEDKYHLPEDIYNDGYNSYFIDIYSRVNAREDRARIMEYAVIGEDWMFSDSPGRTQKLEYLCACIRDAFDTEGWPEKTVWEQTLEQSR